MSKYPCLNTASLSKSGSTYCSLSYTRKITCHDHGVTMGFQGSLGQLSGVLMGHSFATDYQTMPGSDGGSNYSSACLNFGKKNNGSLITVGS